ncbi:MAG: hypothetical protein A2Z25_05845 [Planctomycetes bacterium RBG_16_55_9]|nr:MAG: hypothetical protein A2Z25_05845 [Planctomycetes bacterium RBG_16_55_9]
MDAVISIIGGLLFLVSVAAHLYVRLRVRPKEDFEDYYYEFEDQQPGIARYDRWSRITFAGAAVGVLLLFVAVFI